MNNPFVDSYSRESSKTWGKDFKSLMEDFPDIRARLTASRALSWSGRSLYSCNGGNSISRKLELITLHPHLDCITHGLGSP